MNANNTGRIVVGVDGSASSMGALRWAARQARLTGTALHAVMTWEFPAAVYTWVPAPADIDWEGDTRVALEDTLKTALDAADAEQVVRHVVEGHPAQVLQEASADAELLVVGSRGHGGFAGMLLGSVSQHCAATARCPVVIVHDAAEQPG